MADETASVSSAVAASTETAAPQSGAGSGAASTPGSSGTEPAWYGSVDADTESYIKNKGWKGPGDLLKSYTNLERLRGVGADKLLKLPDFNNADEANAFYERIGVPKAPTDYKAPENLAFDLDTNVLANISHAAKLTPAQHETVVKMAAEHFKEVTAGQLEAVAARDAAEKATLEKSWGPLKDENYQAATKAAVRFGLDGPALDKLQQGLGYSGTMELLAKIGRAFGEAKAPEPSGDNAPFGLTPQVAKERLAALQGDAKFRQSLFDGDAAAREKWENLKKVAFFSG